MAVIDLGKIKLTWRGTYNNSTAYVVDDVVAYTDTGVISTYICVANSTGNAPSSSGTAHASWQYMTKGVALSGSANGDIPYYNGSSYVPLSAGTNGFFLKTQGAGAAPVWAALNEYDDTQVQNNIALLAFKIQTQNSLVKFNLDDQIVDEFIDQSGVDASASTGEAFSAGGWLGLTGTRNWWGDASDGIGNITTNTDFVVPNTSGSYDGDMVIKNYESLTIGAGVTVSTAQPCRGLLIFVDGDCTLNGTISMRGKGPFADPTTSGASDNGTVDTNGIRIPYLHSGSSETLSSVSLAGMGNDAVALASNFPAISSNGKIFNIDRQGNNGGSSVSGSSQNGNSGSSGGNKTGGGGSGGTARAVLSPFRGLGGDPREELRATAVMFNCKTDGAENNTFVVGNDFRQVALMRNPRIGPDSDDSAFVGNSANTLKTLKLTSGGATFSPDKTILGASSNARALIDKVDSNRLYFHQTSVTGFTPFQEAETISEVDGAGTGSLDSAGADADTRAFDSADIDLSSGEILYIDNRAAITRSAAQQEDFKIIIQL